MMKKTFLVWTIFLVVMTCIVWTFIYLSSEGEFEKYSHTSMGIEGLKEDKPAYLSYEFKWNGIVAPTLEKIEFIKRDGTFFEKSDDNLVIEPFVGKADFGSYYEEDAEREGKLDSLHAVQGFKVEDSLFSLALRVEFKDPNWNGDNDISTIRITYNQWGNTQIQNVPFGEGIITDK
jgi:hypothetical protein